MEKKDLKLPKLYKSLLMLALVFGPFYWLAFTDDGQRRTDLALMFVLGKPVFNAAPEAFSSTLTEAELRSQFPKLKWQCADGTNPFGDRLCGAPIGSFAQWPASAVTLFFGGDHLRAVKILYRRAYHEKISDWLGHRVGARSTPAAGEALVGDAETVAAYPVSDGLLVLRKGELGKEEEPALLWISRAALDARH